MLRLVVTGMGRDRMERIIRDLNLPDVSCQQCSDFEGATMVKAGKADVYLGACQSGSGGALAMALALLGPTRCATVSTIGRPPFPDDIRQQVVEGKVAFGMMADHIPQVLPVLVPALAARAGGGGS